MALHTLSLIKLGIFYTYVYVINSGIPHLVNIQVNYCHSKMNIMEKDYLQKRAVSSLRPWGRNSSL